MVLLDARGREKNCTTYWIQKILITELITEANKNIPPDQKMHRIKKPTRDVARTM